MQTIHSEYLPIKIWLNDLEDGAMEQAKNLANYPFAYHHIAIMPDSHQGYGMPIGGVMATLGVVVPNAVGVDIGCGVIAVRTSLTDLNREQLKRIIGGSAKYKGGIRSRIPLGFNHHSKKQDEILMPDYLYKCPIVKQEYESALKQLGTLGGGNHFIEIQKGSDDHIWLMIHSGSRNLGYKVANRYNEIAKERCKNSLLYNPKYNLAWLHLDSLAGKQYLKEMDYCVEFAAASRELMMNRVEQSVEDICPGTLFEPAIDIAHNFAALEHHFGLRVMVHRKGATRAYTGEQGIIPGSQGSCSWITEGMGNPDSFKSCSHGAGRKMGRKAAQHNLNLEEEIKHLDNLGTLHTVRTVKDLDEATGSYKNIDTVMMNQKDLVLPLVQLKPLATIKG